MTILKLGIKTHETFLPILLLVVIVILFTSCEGARTSSGTVIDNQTGLPLDSVLCNVISGHKTVLTDKTGKFNVENPMGACMNKCKDITIEFSKNGFQTQRMTNPPINVTVHMNK